MSSNLSEKLFLSNTTTSTSEVYSSTSETFALQDIHFERLNTVSKTLNLSPINKKDIDRSKTYAWKELHDMKSKIQSCFEHVTDVFDSAKDSNSTIDDDPELTRREIVEELKHKFDNTSKWSEKLQILSVLPSSWSIEKIVNTFGASSYMEVELIKTHSTTGILHELALVEYFEHDGSE
ncbi:unnamed protein product [Psylliodes chrysocephalus]|uniref:Uncharacterized protein n=1 Tax=Psylliodes chrysocephalus TaxID=3402493 RepID=A0A9P0G6F3_9CUCU|nr:unnamed protein product [Psylliodes chrysocephala]